MTEYQKAPEITRQRLYLSTIEEVYSKSAKVLLDVESGNNMMYLPLDQIRKSAPATVGGVSGLSNIDSLTQSEISDLYDRIITEQSRRRNN